MWGFVSKHPPKSEPFDHFGSPKNNVVEPSYDLPRPFSKGENLISPMKTESILRCPNL